MKKRLSKKLLKTLLSFEIVKEIIVIDDGSTDNTYTLAEEVRKQNQTNTTLKVIRLPKNRGKAYAIAKGIKTARYDIVVFCDADLISIKKEHIKALVDPPVRDIADVVLAIRETDRFPFQKITGERAYKKQDLLPYLEKIKTIGRGLEIFLNKKFAGKRIYYFVYPGLIQKGKGNNIIEKTRALDDYIKEGFEIIRGYLKTKEEIERLEKLQHKIRDLIKTITQLQKP